MHIEYNEKYGLVLSDGDVESTVRKLISEAQPWTYLSFANGLAIDHVRLMIAEGTIKHTAITFWYKGIKIKSDKYANLSEWPKGFSGRFDHVLDRLLRARYPS